jgi:dTDP-glucose 4,6-dehydratase/UDP-glucuronate decarboxylase
MHLHEAMPTSAGDVVASDLDRLCDDLKDELSVMSSGRLMVAGGAGFLGYYLVQGALHWNKSSERAGRIHVTVLDNFIRGIPAWLTALSGDANLSLIEHDISAPLPETVGQQDYLIHAASIASPIYYRKYPIETMDANVTGLRHMLEYCRARSRGQAPVKGMLFYSSSEIYGDPTPDAIPTPETYRGNVSCTGPRACYDESKRYGETLCVNFAQQRGIPVKVARPFNNYGPGLKITDGRVIPDFARNILQGRDIVMLSDGSPRRTFCYVSDAVAGYYKILVNGRPGEAYNVGVETPEISVIELAEKIVGLGRSLLNYRGKVVRQKSSDAQYLVDNPNRRCPVITKARTELGFKPRVGIDEGLHRALVWYSGNPEASEA